MPTDSTLRFTFPDFVKYGGDASGYTTTCAIPPCRLFWRTHYCYLRWLPALPVHYAHCCAVLTTWVHHPPPVNAVDYARHHHFIPGYRHFTAVLPIPSLQRWFRRTFHHRSPFVLWRTFTTRAPPAPPSAFSQVTCHLRKRKKGCSTFWDVLPAAVPRCCCHRPFVAIPSCSLTCCAPRHHTAWIPPLHRTRLHLPAVVCLPCFRRTTTTNFRFTCRLVLLPHHVFVYVTI